MVQGVIIKALSGFYYVAAGDQIVECKARGRFRYDGCSPLVGDRVQLSFDAHGKGRIDAVEQRRNAFIRPAVANIDQLIMIGANVNPITDPFLIDRVVAIAENAGCEPVVCLNKCDLDPAEHLYDIYRSIGFRVLRTIKTATGILFLQVFLLYMMNRPGIFRNRQDHCIRPGQNILYDIRQSFHCSRLLRGIMQQYDRRVSGIDILGTVFQ